jgi:hypothetical protein
MSISWLAGSSMNSSLSITWGQSKLNYFSHPFTSWNLLKAHKKDRGCAQ